MPPAAQKQPSSAQFNLRLTFPSGAPKELPNSTTLVVRLDPSAICLTCIHLTPPVNRSDTTRVRTLNCTSTSNPCHLRTYQEGGYLSSVPSFKYPITVDISRMAAPNTTFWCPASHKSHYGEQNRSPRNRCPYWEGQAITSLKLPHLPPRAAWVPARPRDAGLSEGRPFISPMQWSPSWEPRSDHVL